MKIGPRGGARPKFYYVDPPLISYQDPTWRELNYKRIWTLWTLLEIANHNIPQKCYWQQWRIQDFPQGGAPTPKSAIIFQFYPRKLHENERIWTPGGGARPWRPPLDPPMGNIILNMLSQTRLKYVALRFLAMFLWVSTFQNPLVHTDFTDFLKSRWVLTKALLSPGKHRFVNVKHAKMLLLMGAAMIVTIVYVCFPRR